MKTRMHFPWLKVMVERYQPQAVMVLPSFWAQHHPMPSLRRQQVASRPGRQDCDIKRNHRRCPDKIPACPIAPMQEHAQTVSFNLIQEYLKRKRERSKS
jgi:hypothetical protein